MEWLVSLSLPLCLLGFSLPSRFWWLFALPMAAGWFPLAASSVSPLTSSVLVVLLLFPKRFAGLLVPAALVAGLPLRFLPSWLVPWPFWLFSVKIFQALMHLANMGACSWLSMLPKVQGVKILLHVLGGTLLVDGIAEDGHAMTFFISSEEMFSVMYSITKAICIAFVMSFFSFFDVPVFWPILLFYWIVLFFLTMKRQIMHMIKYKYIPFNTGKQEHRLNVPIKLYHVFLYDALTLLKEACSVRHNMVKTCGGAAAAWLGLANRTLLIKGRQKMALKRQKMLPVHWL
ncbi:hypothetical protein IEQ34_004416 [Dendrobium chrysotoxum]|uniref:Uncharacterized protein n=1 Tax=Dendrobium chrysotoxum TaxID=161865 RepID=A0AAV7HID7_DENCH|nr:hypothetical protein IEQ34_004416 [Dendrobium chrysotoxum]